MRYIGSKTKILPHITNLIDTHHITGETFCDIFAGTGSVGQHYKPHYRIISNDLLTFSTTLQHAHIELNTPPTFTNLDIDPISTLNNYHLLTEHAFDKNECFVYQNYTPQGNRMFFQERNALHIDYARLLIDEWLHTKKITQLEHHYLNASILEGVSTVSNIAGTYGAYLKKWDNVSKKEFQLQPPPIVDNNKDNTVYNEDANTLIGTIQGDVLYLDPPYNGRQYLSNYHVLETIARYDYPTLKGVTGQPDYQYGKSDYCKKTTATQAVTELLQKAQFTHIIFSYSTEGIIPVEELEKIFTTVGTLKDKKEIPHKRFKSNTATPKTELKELLYYVKKDTH